jgi:hypothetical protein
MARPPPQIARLFSSRGKKPCQVLNDEHPFTGQIQLPKLAGPHAELRHGWVQPHGLIQETELDAGLLQMQVKPPEKVVLVRSDMLGNQPVQQGAQGGLVLLHKLGGQAQRQVADILVGLRVSFEIRAYRQQTGPVGGVIEQQLGVFQ